MIKVLIIEPDNDIRENIVEILSLEGFLVSNAGTGNEGLAMAILFLPNVILCNIVTYSLNKNELSGKLRKNPTTANIPLILITSQCEKRGLRKRIEMNSSEYLVKPFDAGEMIKAIKFYSDKIK